MVFQREQQRVASDEVLEAIARGDDIRLSGCTISGALDIARLLDEKYDRTSLDFTESEGRITITLHQGFVMHNCIFEGNVVFGPDFSDTDRLAVVFKRDVSFNSSVFRQQVRFLNARFGGLIAFDGCSFGAVIALRGVQFEGNAHFRTVHFNGYCLLNDSVFEKDVRFDNTHFDKGVNFTNVKFGAIADFSGVYSSSRLVPSCEGLVFARKPEGEDETFWRFMKQCALQAGHYQFAGEAFYSERCANLARRFRNCWKDAAIARLPGLIVRMLWLVAELLVGKWLFGYGERPSRVVVAGVIVIIVSALFYFSSGSLLFEGKSVLVTFPDCLYFSVTTFTTLGFGDYYPAPGHSVRYIVMTETLMGAALTALFVVSLAKRFARN